MKRENFDVYSSEFNLYGKREQTCLLVEIRKITNSKTVNDIFVFFIALACNNLNLKIFI